jgi:hypothetical protein
MFLFFHRLFAGPRKLYQMLSHKFFLAIGGAGPFQKNSITGVVEK